jgi:hypothetical protein
MVDRSGLPVNPSKGAIAADVEIDPPVPEIKTGVPEVSPVARPRIHSLPGHLSSMILSATDHFRSIIKNSALPSNQPVQQPPNLEQPALPPAAVLESEEQEPMSSIVVIKASPKPSLPTAEGLGSDAQLEEAVEIATGMDNTSNMTIPSVPNTRKGQPKVKLGNPATRGLSVRMPANRRVNANANARVPAFNGLPRMPPPPTIIRPGRTLAEDKSLENRPRESVTEVIPSGPWTRESFDLFGSWRPPGRDTGTSTVNG